MLFNTLGAARTFDGMSGQPHPIAIGEIEALYRLIGEDEADERVKGLRFIQRMDRVYLEYAAKQLKSESKT